MAALGATVAPDKVASKKPTIRKQSAPKGQKKARGAKPKKPARTGKKPRRQATPRPQSKGAKITLADGRSAKPKVNSSPGDGTPVAFYRFDRGQVDRIATLAGKLWSGFSVRRDGKSMTEMAKTEISW